MDYRKLEKKIFDVVEEEQIKLGYRKETIHLYYPLTSLNHYLGQDCGVDEMMDILKGFCRFEEKKAGKIRISNEGERFCFYLEPQVSEYVHKHSGQSGFLHDFIHAISGHSASIQEIIRVFTRYSDRVHIEEVTNGEFDYLLYFEDGVPDEFRYCLTDEGAGHIIYHRYTKEDYEDFHF